MILKPGKICPLKTQYRSLDVSILEPQTLPFALKPGLCF